MQIKTISVTYDRKHNLGDFSSANIGVTVWADLEPGEDAAQATRALFDQAKAHVKEQLLPLTAKQNGANARMQETFLGQPVQKEN